MATNALHRPAAFSNFETLTTKWRSGIVILLGLVLMAVPAPSFGQTSQQQQDEQRREQQAREDQQRRDEQAREEQRRQEQQREEQRREEQRRQDQQRQEQQAREQQQREQQAREQQQREQQQREQQAREQQQREQQQREQQAREQQQREQQQRDQQAREQQQREQQQRDQQAREQQQRDQQAREQQQREQQQREQQAREQQQREQQQREQQAREQQQREQQQRDQQAREQQQREQQQREQQSREQQQQQERQRQRPATPASTSSPSANSQVSGGIAAGHQASDNSKRTTSQTQRSDSNRQNKTAADEATNKGRELRPPVSDLRRAPCAKEPCAETAPKPVSPDLRAKVCKEGSCPVCTAGQSPGKDNCVVAANAKAATAPPKVAPVAQVCAAGQIWNGIQCAAVGVQRCVPGQISSLACQTDCTIATAGAQGNIELLRMARLDKDSACLKDPTGNECRSAETTYNMRLNEYRAYLGGVATGCVLPDPLSI